MKKALLLSSAALLLSLTSCNFNRGNGNIDNIPDIDLSNVPYKTITISNDGLDSGIIPTSYTSTGTLLTESDINLFSNYMTYDYNGGIKYDTIFLREEKGFLTNQNPILELKDIEFINSYNSPRVYGSNTFNSNWTEIKKVDNKFNFDGKYKYFKIQAGIDKFGFNEMKITYKQGYKEIIHNPYIVKNVKEISENEANKLITKTSKSFTNSSKWQKLGYAKNYEEAKSETKQKKNVGYDQPSDYQLEYNPDLVIANDGESYRVADMQYGDNGNSFRINMLDGSEGPVIYRNCSYTYAEDIAAYITAFGEVPPNMKYESDGKGQTSCIDEWGKNGRCNYAPYSNDNDGRRFKFETECSTHRYFFNPSKNNEDYWYNYYESDYGATLYNNEPYQYSTTYDKAPYNDGNKITRGALRFVWTYSYTSSEHNSYTTSTIDNAYDRNVFYTSNHYNDFQQYLNYYGGWSLRFGNTTLGNGWGEYNSKNHLDQSPSVKLTSLHNLTK